MSHAAGSRGRIGAGRNPRHGGSRSFRSNHSHPNLAHAARCGATDASKPSQTPNATNPAHHSARNHPFNPLFASCSDRMVTGRSEPAQSLGRSIPGRFQSERREIAPRKPGTSGGKVGEGGGENSQIQSFAL
jgi:hypothetical protein